MKCPFCDELEDKVVDSRMAKEGEVIRRRRECLGCKRRYTTYERVEEILPTGTEGAIFDWSIGEPVVARAASSAPVVRPTLRAGDALLFDDRFVHRTAVDPAMSRDRYAIESWFFAPSRYPAPQLPVML